MKITKLIERIKETRATITQLEDLKPQLEAEIKKHAAGLGDIDPVHLLLPVEGDRPMDEASDKKIRHLNTLRSKLEMLPTILGKHKIDLRGRQEELFSEFKGMIAEARRKAREGRDALQKSEAGRLLEVCGGDEYQARKAAEEVVKRSKWQRWFDAFGSVVFSDENLLNTAAHWVDLVEGRFDKGLPLEIAKPTPPPVLAHVAPAEKQSAPPTPKAPAQSAPSQLGAPGSMPWQRPELYQPETPGETKPAA